MRVAVFGKNIKSEDHECVDNLFRQIAVRSGEILIEEDFLNESIMHMPLSQSYCFKTFSQKEQSELRADILFSLGGDGTLLDTLSICQTFDIPVLGINLGHLGFLTSVGKQDCDKLLDKLENGQFKTERHSLLEAEWNEGASRGYALNEVCIRSLSPSELLETEVFVDGEYLSTYSSDGLIAATPTGSTGYNMSAGGPIVEPGADLIILTPICAHTLNTRSIILKPDDNVEVVVGNGRNGGSITVEASSDGNDRYNMESGDRIEIKRSDNTASLIKLSDDSFLQILNKKLQ